MQSITQSEYLPLLEINKASVDNVCVLSIFNIIKILGSWW